MPNREREILKRIIRRAKRLRQETANPVDSSVHPARPVEDSTLTLLREQFQNQEDTEETTQDGVVSRDRRRR